MCALPQSQLSARSSERVDMTRSQRNLGQQTVCVYVCACVHVNSHRYAQKETHTPACACVRVCVRVACVRASCVQVRKFTETSISASLPGSFSLFLTCARASSLSSPFLSSQNSLLPSSLSSSFREICSEQHGQCLSIRFSVKKCLVFSSL